MNELLKIDLNENQEPIISGRELHQVLEVKTKYKDWFPRMVEYGFVENVDYTPLIFEHPQNKQPTTDHALKLDMAKEIAMIQRNEKGKQVRQYFIEVEKEYNSPEKIMARALNIANKQLETLTLVNKQQEQIINELKPKATYYDLILQCPDLLSVTQIAKDYGMSGTRLNKKLNELGIQYKHRETWLLYSKYQDKGYTSSTTHDYVDSKGTIRSRLQTYWTQKGRLFIYEQLKRVNILPLIEKENIKDAI
ncbi:phage antirepressor KilAC domain-containing protein [[Clostridium] colinum]|uniref:phage antirepressor KilAC domain-containing protein n=1 Tax=[Clostridium] colinum TaxID=36835 RepID=UPI00202532C2|nr:phage antirepressor KilAC domain-containing protein [[Clostridium] colinum]